MTTTDTDALEEQIDDALRAIEDGAAGYEVLLGIIAVEVRAAKAEAWDEAYRYGVDDARIADDLRVDVGLGPDLYAQPARQNPYRATEYETGGSDERR